MASVLLMLVMLGVFVQSSQVQALECYRCRPCDDDRSTWETTLCNGYGAICVKWQGNGALTTFIAG